MKTARSRCAMIENGVFLLDPQSPGGQPVSLGDGDGKDEAWGVASIPGGQLAAGQLCRRRNQNLGFDVQKARRFRAQPSDKPATGSASAACPSAPIGVYSRPQAEMASSRSTTSPAHHVAVLETQSPEISRVAFSPDGQKLAALGSDNRLYIWTLGNDDADAISRGERYPPSRCRRRCRNATITQAGSTGCPTIMSPSPSISPRSASVGIDPEKWLKRIDGLALSSQKRQ